MVAPNMTQTLQWAGPPVSNQAVGRPTASWWPRPVPNNAVVRSNVYWSSCGAAALSKMRWIGHIASGAHVVAPRRPVSNHDAASRPTAFFSEPHVVEVAEQNKYCEG